MVKGGFSFETKLNGSTIAPPQVLDEDKAFGLKSIRRFTRYTRFAGELLLLRTKQAAEQFVDRGAGPISGGHYHDRFVLFKRGNAFIITNEAENILGDNFSYPLIIEFGHGRVHNVPLFEGNEPTALGRWAEAKLGFELRVAKKSGNKYYLTSQGNKATMMRVNAPARGPMREGFARGSVEAARELESFFD